MYSPPWFLLNAHLETIYPTLFRKVKLLAYERERIILSDGDFLDIDWLKRGSDRLVIVSHGLEGNSHRSYMKGMARAFYENGFDVLAWNFRGCSGEVNRSIRFYHSGATDDLAELLAQALAKGYRSLFLVGFSLGGNLTLKFTGERKLDSRIKGVAVFSVPLDLHMSCLKISTPSNWIYAQRFLRNLKRKVRDKAKSMQEINVDGIDQIDNILTFDDRYTAPLHGFKDAIDYYRQCSSIYFLDGIKVPTLIVNAKNDPFLSDECYPNSISNPFVTLEYPDRGGHVGFASFEGNGLYWSEQRALDFIMSLSQ